MLWDQEKKTPSYQRIIFWVLAIHGIFIALLYFKNPTKDNYLKHKLVVKNFLEKNVIVKNTVKENKKLAVAAVDTAADTNNNYKQQKSDSLWQQKREEFFKEKLDSFSQIQKAKEQARKKAQEKAASLVKADQRLREQRQKSQTLNKKSSEKKTSQKVLKKKSEGIATKSGEKSSLKNEALRKKSAEKLKILRESLAKLESLNNSVGQIQTQNQTNKNNKTDTSKNHNQQFNNFSSALKPLAVPELKKKDWTARFSADSSSASDLLVNQNEEHEFRELFLDYLKDQLQLPEIGEVKLKLVLSPEGRVVKIEVIRAQSQQNKEYLEEVLPSLAFSFLKNYLKKEKSFMITFFNEE